MAAAAQAGAQPADAAWCDKYRVRADAAAPSGAAELAVFDFGSVKQIPADDWAAAQAAEARERALLPEALRQAQRAKYTRVDAMPHFTLRDGNRIPAVGLGTWKAERGEVRAAVHVALQAGYRHIDCAAVYQNEEEVGEALDAALAGGHVLRRDLFVCSKVWNNDHSAERVRAACLRSLKALRLDYLDLYMIHWPVTGNVGSQVQPPIQETWRAMEALVRDGLVRSLGVSNFSAAKLAAIEAYATIPPSVCQVEVHPYHRNDALIAWCAQRGIHVTAFSPLGSPDSESIFPRRVPAVLLQDPVVKAVAARTGRNVGQVLIRWALQHGTSVIPKSTNPSRIKGNLDVLGWELPEREYAALSTLRFQQRMVNGALWLNPRGPYRSMEELWDEPEIDSEALIDEEEEKAAEKEPELVQAEAGATGTVPTLPPASQPAPKGAAAAAADSGPPAMRKGSGSHPVELEPPSAEASTEEVDNGVLVANKDTPPSPPSPAAGGGDAAAGSSGRGGWGAKLSSFLLGGKQR